MARSFLGYEGLAEYDALIKQFIANYFDGRVFIGTSTAYETAYNNGTIAIGTIVIITDDMDSSSGGSSSGESTDTSSTTSVLGQAILGQMVLG